MIVSAHTNLPEALFIFAGFTFYLRVLYRSHCLKYHVNAHINDLSAQNVFRTDCIYTYHISAQKFFIFVWSSVHICQIHILSSIFKPAINDKPCQYPALVSPTAMQCKAVCSSVHHCKSDNHVICCCYSAYLEDGSLSWYMVFLMFCCLQ